jgi:ribosomal protein L34E
VGANGNKTKMYHLFLKDEIVKNEIQKNIQEQVKTPGGSIAECFQWKYPAKWRVKPIDCLLDKIPQKFSYSYHKLLIRQKKPWAKVKGFIHCNKMF